MLNLLQEVVVAEASNVANFARLTNIMEGVDGAATFGYSVEETAVQVDDNQKQDVYFDHSFDIRVLDKSAESAKLFDFANNDKPVIISGYSPNGFFLWTIPTQLVIQRQFDEITAIAVKATQRTPPNYFGDAPDVNKGIYAGGNALALFDVLNGSSTRLNSVIQDISDPTLTYSIDDSGAFDVQEVTRSSSGSSLSRFASVFFPFPGKELTLSFDATITGAEGDMQLVGRNATDTANVGSASAVKLTAGVPNVTLTIPANSFFIRAEFAPGGSATNAVAISKPRLRIDGQTVFSL